MSAAPAAWPTAETKIAYVAGHNFASIIWMLSELGWQQLAFNRWKSPAGEDVRVVTKAEELYGVGRKSKLYTCRDVAAGREADKIFQIARERELEIVGLDETSKETKND